MKTPWLVAGSTALACLNAHAGAAFMFGISHNFGGDTGVTFKILSSDKRHKPVLAAGVSFLPQRLGLDVGVGYNFTRTTVTFGRDLLNQRYQVAWGVTSTRCPPPPPPPPPAPAPVVTPPPAPPPPPDDGFFNSGFGEIP